MSSGYQVTGDRFYNRIGTGRGAKIVSSQGGPSTSPCRDHGSKQISAGGPWHEVRCTEEGLQAP